MIKLQPDLNQVNREIDLVAGVGVGRWELYTISHGIVRHGERLLLKNAIRRQEWHLACLRLMIVWCFRHEWMKPASHRYL